ncbi:MAG TPA: class I SAM-dependent methyltransferase [Verrucomicrobiae bacterium]|nr:class I SAM-dependent methyltransferase [Verrucomicrobiae bacterium]
MQTTTENKIASNRSQIANLDAIKAKQKATWQSGDYGQIAQSIENFAEEFMARQSLRRGLRVLDVACGTGNLAVIAARHGCDVTGVDIAENLLDQARARAAKAGLNIAFEEGDAEAMPFADSSFDLSISMFGLMFAPQPERVATELQRVTKSGGHIALANWTPEGFIGKMFRVFKTHLPPTGVPSPLDWGNESIVSQRLQSGFKDLRLTRRITEMRFPFSPADTVEYFRKYYGPTFRAFESLSETARQALRHDLVELQTRYNTAQSPDQTAVSAEYLEVIATRI